MRLLDYPIEPVGKVRMTQQDKWKKRPRVMRYRRFKDQCRAHRVDLREGDQVQFYLPMPPSWSKRKRAENDGMPHRQTPDIDNLLGGLMDAVFEDDKALASVGRLEKRWTSGPGRIVIVREEP
jgi:Holliday junction resolvase RusA-like endonuclease